MMNQMYSIQIAITLYISLIYFHSRQWRFSLPGLRRQDLPHQHEQVAYRIQLGCLELPYKFVMARVWLYLLSCHFQILFRLSWVWL
jgi:hypothetical protein